MTRETPAAQDIERAVLGSALLERRALSIVVKLLTKKCFTSHEMQTVFSAIERLSKTGDPVDILTVVQKLSQEGTLQGIGGALYVSSLTTDVVSTVNIETHCRILLQKHMEREVIRISQKAIVKAQSQDEDPFDLIASVAKDLHAISDGVSSSGKKTTQQYIAELDEHVQKVQAGVVPGIPTGVQKYDRNTGGQHKGDLIIYGGRPGMGKTARICCEILHQIKSGYKVMCHSLEMTGTQILARLIGLEIGIPPGDILRRKIDYDVFQKAVQNPIFANLTILENTSLSAIVMESILHKADIIYIDYLQLIKSGHRERYDNITAASMELKQLAKTKGVPVVALAQLSRSVETRGGDKIPQLSDLKESGQIEQDADVVEFLYRPEVYGIMQDSRGFDTIGKAYYVNAKCRSGEPGITVEMDWDGPLNKLSDPQQNYDSNSFPGAIKRPEPEEDGMPF